MIKKFDTYSYNSNSFLPEFLSNFVEIYYFYMKLSLEVLEIVFEWKFCSI